MERHCPFPFSNQPPYSYQDVLASLEFFDVEKLQNIANLIQQHVSTKIEISKLVSSIPDEIWEIILTYACREASPLYKNFHRHRIIARSADLVGHTEEKILKLLRSVCRTWYKCGETVAQRIFQGYMTKSDWILSRFRNVKNLRLDMSKPHLCSSITNEAIRKMTNVTYLALYFVTNNSKIKQSSNSFYVINLCQQTSCLTYPTSPALTLVQWWQMISWSN